MSIVNPVQKIGTPKHRASMKWILDTGDLFDNIFPNTPVQIDFAEPGGRGRITS